LSEFSVSAGRLPTARQIRNFTDNSKIAAEGDEMGDSRELFFDRSAIRRHSA